LTGQRIRPPALEEPGPGEIDEDDANRQKKQKAANNIDPDAHAFGHHPVEQINAYMLVQFERVGGAQQDHAGEHVPLDFKPGV
jgi:hypothetical protein